MHSNNSTYHFAAIIAGDPHYKFFGSNHYNHHFQGRDLDKYVVLRIKDTTTNKRVFDLHARHKQWPGHDVTSLHTLAFGTLDGNLPVVYQVLFQYCIWIAAVIFN